MAMTSYRGGVVAVVLLFALAEWFSTVHSGSIHSVLNSRNKRSFTQLGDMIKCTTGRNPMNYNNYGCYCGIGGHGIPLDDTDRCCQAHDNCYWDAMDDAGCTYFEIFVIYKHSCTSCAPLSEYDHNDKHKDCKMALCQCDAVLAHCLDGTTYNEAYQEYPRWNCL
ncbi:basic phospholipase A2 DE-1-like [Glandiceps talaboti]